MTRFYIIFRVEDGDRQVLVPEQQLMFFAGDNLYDRLTNVMLLMAKLIKAALCPEVKDATPRS